MLQKQAEMTRLGCLHELLQGYMEAEQSCSEECEIGHPCKIDEKLQASASMVVPRIITWECGPIPFNVFCVEERCPASMVGDALCICFGLACYPPHWNHSGNYQPGEFFFFLY